MSAPLSKMAPIVVPPSVRRRAGIKPGEKLKFEARVGVITITAKRESTEDEYTPAQRRKILRGIRKGLAQIETGQFYGPYNSVDEMAADIEAEIRSRKSKRASTRK
jgi:bifunctional DNA-binding transcriptional regulator/antitoxin component of YhaV-PrlF toxin-antitoxin module